MIFATGFLTSALVIGVPIAFALLAATLIYYLASPVPNTLVVQSMVSTIESFPLLAIPLFVLAGSIMAHGGVASRLLDLADGLVGHFRGGLGQVNVLNSLMVGGMSGSSNADAAIDARILVPVMVKKGYPLDYASALSAASGIISPLLPPSIALIMYGLLAQVSVGQLFIAGIVPGLLLAVALSLVVRVTAGRKGYGSTRRRMLPFRELLPLLGRASWSLMMPVLLLVGLRVGVFTPTELAAFAVLYVLFIAVVVHRDLKLSQLPKVVLEASLTSAVLMLIIGAAGAFGTVLTRERVPQFLTRSLMSVAENPVVLLLLINLVLLVLGTFLEGTSVLIIVAPLLAPMALAVGVDPVQFGVMIVLNLVIGALTPPVGTVMFTVCSITGSTIKGYTIALLPFLGAILVVLMMVAFIPAISLTLPALFFGG